MMELTPEQREITGSIVATMNEVDWNGDITPYIDQIVSIIGRLVAEDSGFVEFAEAISDQSNRWAVAAWTENIVPTMGDSGWSKLSDQLAQFIPA